MRKTLLDYFSKKRKKPCNESQSVSQVDGQSSAESQESISRMSVSISDEIETCIDYEELWHIPSTTEVHDRQRSEVCLLDVPPNSSTERASILEAAIATADDESRPFVVDLDSHIEKHVQDEPLKNHPSVSPLFEKREVPYQRKLKVYPGTRFGNKLRCFKSSWYSEYKWLEYNDELDASFCFTCRRFLPNPTEMTFTGTGFCD